MDKLKTLPELVIKLNKGEENNERCTNIVWSNLIRRLTQYFFLSINEEN